MRYGQFKKVLLHQVFHELRFRLRSCPDLAVRWTVGDQPTIKAIKNVRGTPNLVYMRYRGLYATPPTSWARDPISRTPNPALLHHGRLEHELLWGRRAVSRTRTAMVTICSCQ